MDAKDIFADLKGKKIHLVGIKGTGMSALAELLLRSGAHVEGSDTCEKFYTDEILDSLSIRFNEGFAPENIARGTECVIYSSAYDVQKNQELAAAVKMGIPVVEYAEALALFASKFDFSGISGVHGKTTTTAIAGTLLKVLDVPASILCGSAAVDFGGRSTFVNGNSFFVAETCEYKRHFLAFHPDRIVVTGIEPDHLDCYPSYKDIFEAFVSYADLLPAGGILIYCADDAGACGLAEVMGRRRKDITIVPYGENADGEFKITGIHVKNERSYFTLAGFRPGFSLRIPGKHIVLDAAAAFALVVSILRKWKGEVLQEDVEKAAEGFVNFRGSKRRCEILGTYGGIMFIDDYAHHPTEIKKTLEGIRSFYPERKIIVDFMSHTYSRTEGLLNEFSSCFSDADEVILNDIYPSAREKKKLSDVESLNERFYGAVSRNHPSVKYFKRPEDGLDYLKSHLKNSDIFITMGAGNSWIAGKKLCGYFSERAGRGIK